MLPAVADREIPPPERKGCVVSLYQCVKSVENPLGLTRTLGQFKVLGYCTGNSAAIFEVLADDGRHLRLKCYTRPKENLEAIYGNRLLKEELYVYTGDGGVWIDVVVDEWIEGETLGVVIRRAAAEGDTERLAVLAGRFDMMAREMLSHDWAHGDLKPDNIIVTTDGWLRMIDFDAVYLPALRRTRSRELGTAAWQHPSRSYSDYDRNLDDYPIAMISTLLHALAVDTAILGRYADADGMPLDSCRIAEERCAALDHIERMFAEGGMAVQYRVARLLHSRAYILPQLAEYLSYNDFAGEWLGTPELFRHDGFYGVSCGGQHIVPPLYDDILYVGCDEAEVVLGGVCHNVKFVRPECQKD